MTSPSSFTRMRSDALIRLKETPKGFTQNVVGSTGSRSVMWPATPSSKPYLPKIRKAADHCKILPRSADGAFTCKFAFQIRPLFVWIVELWRTGNFELLNHRFRRGDTWFKRCSIRGFRITIAMRLDRRWWRHGEDGWQDVMDRRSPRCRESSRVGGSEISLR